MLIRGKREVRSFEIFFNDFRKKEELILKKYKMFEKLIVNNTHSEIKFF